MILHGEVRGTSVVRGKPVAQGATFCAQGGRWLRGSEGREGGGGLERCRTMVDVDSKNEAADNRRRIRQKIHSSRIRKERPGVREELQ